MIVLYILIALLILMLMITIHELGHYLVGKKLGFKINEFSIGFGKAIWQKTNKTGEKISLRILPLGGYCAFFGEEDAVDEEGKPVAKDDPRLFNNQKPWKRILVYVAGVTFNFLSAILFAFILLVTLGYGNEYKVVDTVNPHFAQVALLDPNNDLEKFEAGDKILKINGQNVDYVWGKTLDQLVPMTVGQTCSVSVQKMSGEMVEYHLVVQHNIQQEYNKAYDTDKTAPKYIDSVKDGNLVYIDALGFNAIALSSHPVPFFEALWQCFSLTIGFAWLVLKTFWLLITFQLPLSSLGGTLTVISTVASSLTINLGVILVYLPLIAVNLAVFNLLPFPALDGGHVAFTSVEAIRGKPINRDLEAKIHFIGLIVVFAFVIFLDLYHFLS